MSSAAKTSLTPPVLRLKNEAVTWTPTDDGIVALDLRTSRYLTVNQSAAVLWQLLARGAKRDELVIRLTEEFDVAPGVAGQDVDDLIADLTERELVDVEQ